MRRRLTLIPILAAWLLATGSHWDLVQTFAWGRMIATYSQTMPLAQAVKLTFTPDNLCGVCEIVSDAKQQSPDSTLPTDGSRLTAKAVLLFQPAPVFLQTLVTTALEIPRDLAPLERDKSPPPVPPPRALA